VKADDSLLQAVNEEIRQEQKQQQGQQATEQSLHEMSDTSDSEETAPVTPSTSSSSDPIAPPPLADGWQVWKDADRPFKDEAERAEYEHWERVLAEEAEKVDKEMAEEMEMEMEQDDDEDDVEEMEEMDDDDDGDVEEESIEEVDDEVEAASLAPAPSQSSTAPRSVTDKLSSSSSKLSSSGSRVRVRMFRGVGGENVMEISGEDADDDDDGGEYEDWDDDIDLEAEAAEAEAEANDPDAEVGRGVGGVAFTRRDLMELNEKDLVESFVKGSGRGGQKVNKTNSCVQLLHKPTGTRVRCQFSRDLQANRKRARTIMRQRLEELLLGAQSRTAMKAAKERKKKDRKRRKRAKKFADVESESQSEAATQVTEGVGQERLAAPPQPHQPLIHLSPTTLRSANAPRSLNHQSRRR